MQFDIILIGITFAIGVISIGIAIAHRDADLREPARVLAARPDVLPRRHLCDGLRAGTGVDVARR
ncbi:MAG: hypothetical protein MZU79_01625 [Anaerotruncus sp.]|nr:hypothetical protein [Anaerotruncus sp.]